MKILVTGYPGTGKSSIVRELKKRGRYAYDTEAIRSLMHAEDNKTGVRIPLPQPVPRGWFETIGGYDWNIPRLSEILNSHDDVFICALADNQESLYDTFDKIFLLLLDEVDMEHRLQTRTTTDYGKNSDELADIMQDHRHFEESLLNAGAIAIDVKKAIPEVVDEILSHVTNP
jgi:hypothetical protein